MKSKDNKENQLKLKDDIINDLHEKLLQEQKDNQELKKQISYYEAKIMLLEKDTEKEDNTENNKFNNTYNQAFSKSLITNKDYNSNLNEETNNINHLKSLIETKNQEIAKFKSLIDSLNQDLQNQISKSRSIEEIEKVYQIQISNLKKKLSNFDLVQEKLREQEKYIQEILFTQESLEKNHFQVLQSKALEYQQLESKFNLERISNEKLNQQITALTQNSNNFSQEVFRDLKFLEEKNKELEFEIINYKNRENQYNEELRHFKNLVSEDKRVNNSNNNIYLETNSNQSEKEEEKSKNIQEVLANISSAIKKRIDSQNRTINNQKVEILSQRVDLERLKADLSNEKELCERLQKTLAEKKFLNSNFNINNNLNNNNSNSNNNNNLNLNNQLRVNNLIHVEEACCQTIIKGEEYDQLREQRKNYYKEMEEMSEKLNFYVKNEEILVISLNQKEKELMKIKSQVEVLARKLNSGSALKDSSSSIVNEISQFSQLNSQLTAMKLREQELSNRINYLEAKIKEDYNNNDINNNSNNVNLSSNSNENNDNNKDYDAERLHTFGDKIAKSSMNSRSKSKSKSKSKIKDVNYLKSSILSFGSDTKKLYSSYATVNNSLSNINNLNKAESPKFAKYIETDRLEQEIKKLQEDNLNLKEQNFTLLNNMTRIEEDANIQKIGLSNNINNLEELLHERDSIIEEYSAKIRQLNLKLDSSNQINDSEISEMRRILDQYEASFKQISEQFVSLQKKFECQSKILDEKNRLCDETTEKLEEADRQRVQLTGELNRQLTLKSQIEDNYTTVIGQNKCLYSENENLKIDFSQNLKKFETERQVLNQKIAELSIEVEKSSVMNNQLKGKLKEFYDEMKEKDDKIAHALREEGKEIEARLLNEIELLRRENESLLKDRSNLRLSNNDLKFEIAQLKQNCENNFYSEKYSNSNKNHESKHTRNLSYSKNRDYENTENINTNNNDLREKENDNNNNNRVFKSTLTSKLRELNKNNTNNNNSNSNNNKQDPYSDIVTRTFDENVQLKNDIEELLIKLSNYNNRVVELENTLESITHQQEYLKEDLTKSREREKTLNLELNSYKEYSKNANLEALTKEIDNKNETINYLLGEFENNKKTNNNEIAELKKEISELKEKISLKSDEVIITKQVFESNEKDKKLQIEKLEEENKFLLQEIEEKEKELNKLNHEYLADRTNWEEMIKKEQSNLNHTTEQYDSCYAELTRLKNLYSTDYNNNADKLSDINEKFQKSKNKVDKLVDLYENHIKFLKERFDAFTNDMRSILLVKNLKNEEKIKNIVSVCDNLGSLMVTLSQREAAIESFKSELKAVKQSNVNLKAVNSKLMKEKDELIEICNIKKLQKKINNNSNINNSKNNANNNNASEMSGNSSFNTKIRFNINNINNKPVSSEVSMSNIGNAEQVKSNSLTPNNLLYQAILDDNINNNNSNNNQFLENDEVKSNTPNNYSNNKNTQINQNTHYSKFSKEKNLTNNDNSKIKFKNISGFDDKNLKYYEQLSNIQKIIQENSELKLQEYNLNVKLQSALEEVRLYTEKLQFSKEKNEQIQAEKEELESNIKTMEGEISNMTKKNKQELSKLVDEIKKVKEKFVPQEKHNEALVKISDCEKSIKNLKEEINRKSEYISALKEKLNNNNSSNNNQSNSVNQLNTTNYNEHNNTNDEVNQLNDKIKSLSKEIKTKENLIKELRSSNEQLKNANIKVSEENATLQEKTKISKIDISRKENIIKDLKEKLGLSSSQSPFSVDSNTNTNNSNINSNNNKQAYINIHTGKETSSTNTNNNFTKQDQNNNNNNNNIEKLKESNKKLKQDIERKENFINTLKAKVDNLTKELEEVQSANQRLQKFTSMDTQSLRDELDNSYRKMQQLKLINEQLKSLSRRILNDLVNSTERRTNYHNPYEKDFLKEGLDILSINENDMNEFLIGENNNKFNKGFNTGFSARSGNGTVTVSKQIDELIGCQSEIDVEELIKIYNLYKGKLIDYASENRLNKDTQMKYNEFAKTINVDVNVDKAKRDKLLNFNSNFNNSNKNTINSLGGGKVKSNLIENNSDSAERENSKKRVINKYQELDNLMGNLKSLNKIN